MWNRETNASSEGVGEPFEDGGPQLRVGRVPARRGARHLEHSSDVLRGETAVHHGTEYGATWLNQDSDTTTLAAVS